MTKPLCVLALGMRGTGKTGWCRQYIEREVKPARLAVWDFKHDPNLVGLGTTYTDLASMARAMMAPRFSVRYLVDHTRDLVQQFEQFCQACWLASQLLMYVAELPEVTKPNRASPTWRRCINVGREYTRWDGQPGWLAIVADAQRPTECDKSIVSNADIHHCGRLPYEDDARQLANVLGVPFRDLQQLPDLHWVERRGGGTVTAGVLSFGAKVKKKPAAKPAPARSLRKVA